MKKIVVLLLILTLVFVGCKGNTSKDPGKTDEVDIRETENRETEPNYEELYSDLLDEFYTFMTGDMDSYPDGAVGVMEIMGQMETEQLFNSVGYSITDLSGDGVPELVIGSIAEEGAVVYGTVLYAVFTLVDESPVLVIEGMSRNCYRPMENGEILFSGSSGAMYSSVGIYTLSNDGKSLVVKDYYFTHETDESFAEIGVFHNTTGEWDVNASEKLDITYDELWDMEAEYSKSTMEWELTPFAELER